MLRIQIIGILLQIHSMYCVTYSSLLDKLREESTKTIPETIITIPVKIPQARYFRTYVSVVAIRMTLRIKLKIVYIFRVQLF